MRRATHIALFAVISAWPAAAPMADSLLTEHLDLMQPGLSVTVVAEFPIHQDVCDGSRNDPSSAEFGTGFYCEAPGGPWRVGSGTDSDGSFYQVGSGGVVLRKTASGLEEVVRTQGCLELEPPPGGGAPGLYFHSDIKNLIFDAATGSLYLAIYAKTVRTSFAFNCSSVDQQSAGIIRIDGLPSLLDSIPQGPPGPEGPSGPTGPQGPPGPLLTPCPDADADAFRDCVTIQGCFPYGGACGDCNDGDPTINPRGSETTPKLNRHDGKDNDCNGVADG